MVRDDWGVVVAVLVVIVDDRDGTNHVVVDGMGMIIDP
jgi:hypothetical protein